MVVIVVKPVHDANAKGIGIAEGAIIDACHIKMFGKTIISFGFNDSIQVNETLLQMLPLHSLC